MAFSTLDAIRNPGLDRELGIDPTNDATDTSFGDTGARNFYLQRAFALLWPTMGRLRKVTLPVVANQTEYDVFAVTTVDLRSIERIDLIGSSGNPVDSIRDYQFIRDEDDATPNVRLVFSAAVDTSYSLRLIGYTPYAIPATGATACDLPPELEYVVCAGARLMAYRAKLATFANYGQFNVDNRANALSSAELGALVASAERDFREFMEQNRRAYSAPRRAMSRFGTG